MQHRLTMVYWEGQQFWLGKLSEHPEIMPQGETLEEVEENLMWSAYTVAPGCSQYWVQVVTATGQWVAETSLN
jgi:hypothetical protein